LQVQAAEQRAEQQRAHDEAKELARQAAELQRELGGPQVWQSAQQQAERAQARYPDERREAQRGDEAELDRARIQIARRDLAAAQAGTQREELIAEQQLREAMPQSQRIAEKVWRIEVHEQETARALEQAAAQPDLEPDVAAPGVDLELDYHARTMDRGLDIDRGGPSLGL
jgi:DNA gyrase/topoisomerase IV subunit A